MLLHLLASQGKLDPLRHRIRAAFSDALRQIGQLLPVDQLDVVIFADKPGNVLPELGASARALNGDAVLLGLDPHSAVLQDNLEQILLGLLARESLRCARRGRNAGTDDLADALVSAGLACHFEHEITGRPPIYASALSESQLALAWSSARSEMKQPACNGSRWFESQAGDLPRHAGFTLGYRVVGQRLRRLHKTAAQTWAEPARVFIEDYAL